MIRRILLVRHARSSHVHDGRWMFRDGVDRFEDAYDAAGIHDDSHPPAELSELAANATLVSSDMPRAIETARRLTPAREFSVSPLLREYRLDPPRWIPLPLPITVWGLMDFYEWTWRLRLGVDHAIVQRARDATEWMVQNAGTSDTLIAVTHGGFRRMLAAALAARAWRPGSERRRYHNWSAWSFTPP